MGKHSREFIKPLRNAFFRVGAGSQRFSEITRGVGGANGVRDMTFDLKGRLVGWGPTGPPLAAGAAVDGRAAHACWALGARRRPISVPLTVRRDLLPRYRASAASLHPGRPRPNGPAI